MQPKIDVILFVGRGVLDKCESDVHNRAKTRTRIMARKALIEPNAALAGVMFEISFARVRVSMITFNFESTLSRPFRCYDVGAIVVVVRKPWGREAVRM
jgi:hypothetical protein